MATAPKDFKPIIIDALTVLMKSDQIRKEKFKAIAYQKVIKELQAHTGPIRTIEDVEGIKGIGKKIQAKIEEILATGELAAAVQAATNLQIDVYDQLLKVHGIGPVKARKLVEDFGVKSIEDLRSKSATDPSLLDTAQKIGLKYFEDFNERIPRAEMEHHVVALETSKPSNMKIEIVGSYRRGAESSGDIDVLINFPRQKTPSIKDFQDYVGTLQAANYITDILALGSHKCMAVSTVGGQHRRLDLLLTPNEQWPFAILYFTGSDRFNVAMRAHALSLGWSLNEKGFTATNAETAKETLPPFKTERDIFGFLGLQYIKPTERTGADKIIPL
jgi:DNA polymerase beta